MSKTIRIITCFLLIALCLPFASCEKQELDSPSETEAETNVTELVVFADGATDYVIVRGEDTSETVVNACRAIRDAFKDATGADIKITTDFSAEYQKIDITKAIVVGVIDDELSAGFAEGLKTDEYKSTISGDRIYISAGSDSALLEAAQAFAEKYLSDTVTQLVISSDSLISKKMQTKFDTITLNGTDIRTATVIYDGTLSSKGSAETLKGFFEEAYGTQLKVANTAPKDAGCVFYVGTFKGSELSQNTVAQFDRPNYYWADIPNGKEYFFIGEGAATMDAAVSAFCDALSAKTEKNAELSEIVLNGDIGTALKGDRDSAADVRVMTSNVLWMDDQKIATQKRCEYMTDVYLAYQVDVICFNEFYANPLTYLSGSLSGYYDIIFPEFEDVFNGDWTGYTNDLIKLQKHVQATPIAVRKNSGLKYVDGGFRYTSEKWWIHSITWVLLETQSGKRFAVINNHYGDQAVGNFAKDTLSCAEDIRKKYGDIPTVICGDLYTKRGETAYNTLISGGFTDSCFNSATRGSNVGYGSYHELGNMATGSSVPIDHILFSGGKFESLRYHIIVSKYTKWTSDHYPIYADLKIK